MLVLCSLSNEKTAYDFFLNIFWLMLLTQFYHPWIFENWKSVNFMCHISANLRHLGFKILAVTTVVTFICTLMMKLFTLWSGFFFSFVSVASLIHGHWLICCVIFTITSFLSFVFIL
uniref:Uncharacterized protein n=1 Tax=Manihot esculenta TaxID=3983 RepID=A0A2C9VUZ7_MANES